MDFGAHLPLIDLGGVDHSLGRLDHPTKFDVSVNVDTLETPPPLAAKGGSN